VYHVGAKKDSDLSETLKVMERRLLRFIMNPAMIITWALGLLMLWSNAALLEQGWMHAKLALVILMSVLHMMFAKWRKTFAVDENTRSAKFYKIWNEAPTLLMIAIVVLAVVKPF
jgi:putative membrane protein